MCACMHMYFGWTQPTIQRPGGVDMVSFRWCGPKANFGSNQPWGLLNPNHDVIKFRASCGGNQNILAFLFTAPCSQFLLFLPPTSTCWKENGKSRHHHRDVWMDSGKLEGNPFGREKRGGFKTNQKPITHSDNSQARQTSISAKQVGQLVGWWVAGFPP